MKKKFTPIIFWTLSAVFLFLLAQFLIPPLNELFRGPIFLLPIGIFFLLGIALIVSTIKEKVRGKLKIFLLLCGISATSFFACIILHNAFYAFSTVTEHIKILYYLFEILHVIFFLLAIPVCPIVFIVGLIGSAILLIKQKKASNKLTLDKK